MTVTTPRAPTEVAISPTDEIVSEARWGCRFILVDHKENENEGNLVIPAMPASHRSDAP